MKSYFYTSTPKRPDYRESQNTLRIYRVKNNQPYFLGIIKQGYRDSKQAVCDAIDQIEKCRFSRQELADEISIESQTSKQVTFKSGMSMGPSGFRYSRNRIKITKL